MSQPKSRFKVGELVRIEDELAMFSGQKKLNIGIVYKVRLSADHFFAEAAAPHYEYKIYWQNMNENVDEWMPEMFLKRVGND